MDLAVAEPPAVAAPGTHGGIEPNFYSRYEHGSRPIWITESGGTKIYKVGFDDRVAEFTSTRQLLMALDPRGKDNHLTFDRYFRTGRFDKEQKSEPKNLLDLLAPTPNPIILPTDLTIAQKVTPRKKKAARKSDIVVAGSDLGIDLAKRGHEVAKLMYAGFARRILRAGYDPEDVLQEVYRGILARNNGICPFDVKKSSFGHYVHMVINCVLSNFHRKEQRRMEREQVGMMSYSDDGWRNVDVAEANIAEESGSFVQEELEVSYVQDELLSFLQGEKPTREHELATQILPLMRLGHSRKEIAAEIGVSRSTVSKVLAFIKRGASDWANLQGLEVTP